MNNEVANKPGLSESHVSIHSNVVSNDLGDGLEGNDPVPDVPLLVLQPSKGISIPNLYEVWLYRELLLFLTWRDIAVRYKQTILGVGWAVIQPLAMMIIISIFFSGIPGMSSNGISYPFFVLSGLIPWTFFANSVTNSSNSLVGSANLITKVYFPRMIIPSAAVLASLVDLLISFSLILVFMFYYGVGIKIQFLLLLPLIILLTLLSLATGMWMSALNVKYRDVRYALPFCIQLWMFATPIIYPIHIVSDHWQWLLSFNPLTGIVDGVRFAIFGTELNSGSLALSIFITLFVTIFSCYYFRRVEREFADVV